MLIDEPENEAERQLLLASEGAQWKFYRPRPGEPPTCHIYMPNVNHISDEQLLSLLKPFGRVLDLRRGVAIARDPGNCHVNITFATAESAAAAIAALDRTAFPDSTGGGVMRLFPSVLHKQKEVRDRLTQPASARPGRSLRPCAARI